MIQLIPPASFQHRTLEFNYSYLWGQAIWGVAGGWLSVSHNESRIWYAVRSFYL